MSQAAQAVLEPGELAGRLSTRFRAADLFERVAVAATEVPGRLVFTTSLGLEDQAIAHAIFSQDLAVDVVTLDTGRLFPETYQLWADTERRYGRRIRVLSPDHHGLEALVARQGIDGFRTSIEARIAQLEGEAAAEALRAELTDLESRRRREFPYVSEGLYLLIRPRIRSTAGSMAN